MPSATDTAAPSKKRAPAGKSPRVGRPPATRARLNDPDMTRRNILEIATQEFSAKGLSGARIDRIAARTRTSKRMLYYYFGSKEGLYIAVLENAYSSIRAIEADLDLENLDPISALRRLVGFTFDYENGNPDFIRLVMNENIHKGSYLARSKLIRKLNVPAIDAIRRVYERGCAEKLFRPGLDPVELHWAISALCFFNVSNRHTFDLIFDRDTASPKALGRRRAHIIDMILRDVLR